MPKLHRTCQHLAKAFLLESGSKKLAHPRVCRALTEEWQEGTQRLQTAHKIHVCQLSCHTRKHNLRVLKSSFGLLVVPPGLWRPCGLPAVCEDLLPSKVIVFRPPFQGRRSRILQGGRQSELGPSFSSEFEIAFFQLVLQF